MTDPPSPTSSSRELAPCTRRWSLLALASLVLGLATLWPLHLALWIITGPIAALLAVFALVAIARSQGRLKGRGLAALALAAALIGLIGPWLILPRVIQARQRAEMALTRNELRQLGLAIHNYNAPAGRPVPVWNRLNDLLQQSLSPDAGGDLIGQEAKPWQLTQWGNSEPIDWNSTRGRVVFVRFWTDTCPCCKQTMMAIQQLADDFRGEPIRFIGIYYSEPRGSERPWAAVLDTASKWNVTFPIAFDQAWRTADEWWVRDHPRSSTSASFVIDGFGKIAYVHPGSEFHNSFEPEHAKCDLDFLLIRTAIRRAIDDLRPNGVTDD
jgi:thiol-disulfide isomerase/thioredoxin